ncbi:DUF397 domain-containing protein [Streptomyces sp. NBC_00536]|uniref:DUF397 domain-containing protein n=1 Tax=Streptomyces sp. NBC_00536 TaxID=2975769 RepID=UPI002E800950|nr:DUF397 domain-containing protein [Streptomyces sp. NBC_00536]WUC81995.1 DUF397 domain-containing protein [Streptomyces sp. NBC_00536]
MTPIISPAITSGLVWSKSSYSEGAANCLEIAHGVAGAAPVRDSKRPTGPAVVFGDSQWATFVDAVKAGQL